MAFEKAATLAPFSNTQPDTLPAVWLTLECGEWAVLGAGHFLLKISPHQKSTSSYKVETLTGVQKPLSQQDGIAEDWDLSSSERILKPDISRNAGLLLLPSLVGPNLYGGDLPTGERLRQLYGVIRPIFDEDDKRWGLQIVMPDDTKPGFEELEMFENTSD